MTGVSFRTDWKQSGLVSKLLAELNTGTEANSDGSITFVANDHSDLFFLLADGLTYPSDLTRNDASAISYRAFLDLRKQGIVTEKPLLADIGRRVRDLQAAPRGQFTMWSKCRLRQMSFHPASRFQLDGVSIRTAAHLPHWLRLDEHFISGVGPIHPNQLPSFGYIIFSVEARNENEASRRIFDACDLFFAIVNTAWRSTEFWTSRRPTAKLWLGPNQFFFQGKSFIGKDHVWHNQNFNEDEWNLFPSDVKEFNRKRAQFRRVISALSEHPLRRELRAAMMLINDGMISKDLSYRLMRFWSAAETLYSKNDDKTNHKAIIERLTFVSKESPWLDRIKIERCYHMRNSYVHRGSQENDDTTLVQHLRELILQHVYYYIFNASDIATHDDLLMMVDLPSSIDALDRRVLAIERRKSISQSGRHQS